MAWHSGFADHRVAAGLPGSQPIRRLCRVHATRPPVWPREVLPHRRLADAQLVGRGRHGARPDAGRRTSSWRRVGRPVHWARRWPLLVVVEMTDRHDAAPSGAHADQKRLPLGWGPGARPRPTLMVDHRPRWSGHSRRLQFARSRRAHQVSDMPDLPTWSGSLTRRRSDGTSLRLGCPLAAFAWVVGAPS